MKKPLVFFLLFLFVFNVSAQDKLLPLDPEVRMGTLDNGLRYYIRKNAKPEKRAELRLAVNAGSTSETDLQQGLAHLVEHMAFNGTANFRKNELVDYLESVGTRFGPHLNAYTSFDETVYMLQIPTDSAEILSKAFQILEDWAHQISFDSVEVEKERGVVIEEWRLGQGADERMRRQYWPHLFKDSRYAVRLPIGQKEIIEKSSIGTIRSFYTNWYVPENMAVIAVGDFDPAAIEKRVREQFSKIPKSKEARRPEVYPVPDNKEAIITTATDKEAVYTEVELIYKQPRDSARTEADYRRYLAQGLFSMMMNARLAELQRQPEPPFMYASSYYGPLVRPKYAWTSSAVCREDAIIPAVQTLINENERVRRFGFTQTELSRQKNELMSQVEKAYNEREKSESRSHAREYVSNFLSNEPIPGIEFEYTFTKSTLPAITLEEVNAFARKWITDGENCIVLITAPEKETTKMPDRMMLSQMISGMESLSLTPYEDKVSDKPLVESKPKAGKVVSQRRDDTFGISEWKLDNGITVFVKPTDFKNDEILFSSYSWGGWSLYDEKDFHSAASADEIVDESGVGDFDLTTLEKMLAGKIVSCTPYISELQEGFSGSCAPKDIETMMQLVYSYVTKPRKDPEAFRSYTSRQKGLLQNRGSDPQAIFYDTVQYVMSGYNYRYRPRTAEMIDLIGLDRAFEIYNERFSDLSGAAFFFVGNVDTTALKSLCESYLGSLPSAGKNETWKDINAVPPAGKIEKTVTKGEEDKSAVILKWHGPFEYNRNNRNEVAVLNKLISLRLREVLREEKSGVYGVGFYSNPKHYPVERIEHTVSFGCSPANVDMLVSSVHDVLKEVREKGCEGKNLVKIRETFIRERETALKENRFWLNTLVANHQNMEDLKEILTFNDWISSLKGSDFITFYKKYFPENNYAKFVLVPAKSN